MLVGCAGRDRGARAPAPAVAAPPDSGGTSPRRATPTARRLRAPEAGAPDHASAALGVGVWSLLVVRNCRAFSRSAARLRAPARCPACLGPSSRVTAQEKTVEQGVYTNAQAARGAKTFETNCTGCHREPGGTAPILAGERFAKTFGDATLQTVFTTIKTHHAAQRAGHADRRRVHRHRRAPAAAQQLRRRHERAGRSPTCPASRFRPVGQPGFRRWCR